MAEERNISLPLTLNLDVAYERLKPTESPLIKSLGWDINANPINTIGTNNPTGEGQNQYVITPERANELIANVVLPDTGFNKTIGSFESITTQELYHANYNSEGYHAWYVIDGNTGAWSTIIIDKELGFTNDPKAFIADHRVTLRVVYDKDGNIIEKHLIYTDGFKWQGWINVVAAQKTNGFDTSLFPYWTLMPPHFDRRELLEYAPRPPMYKPEIKILQNTIEDEGKINYMADKAFQICYGFINTDGRDTTVSPYSLPIITTQTDYLYNQDKMPKKAELTLYAGSCMTEKIAIYAREAVVEDGTGSTIAPEWGEWFKVEIINKFTDCGVNDVGNDYWLRTNQWADFNYDSTFNTIKYIFDNSRRGAIVDQDSINRLFNEMPLRSKAQSDLGDAILECNNEYGYDNFGCDIIDNLTTQVAYVVNSGCVTQLRRLRLYAYIGRSGSDNVKRYASQVGYYLGEDTQMRFGGMEIGLKIEDQIILHTDESMFFKLDFADHDALVCYLKGTPFYSVGKWATVSTEGIVTLLDGKYDFSLDDVKIGVQNILKSGEYFVCVFDFIVPAGRYIATLGRHNTNITEDFRGQSTYIMGIADSQNTSIVSNPFQPDLTVVKASAIVSFSKEIEIDCVNSDVDIWGNGKDLFYVFCPCQQPDGENYRFIEGYLLEQISSHIPVELFPYDLINLHEERTDDSGTYTDKNGFYFAYEDSFYANTADIRFTCKLNCTYPFVFTSPTPNYGSGWRPDNIVYLADHSGHGGQVGDCNRILQNGIITNIDGTIPYSNISISIVDGSTVVTNQNGEFQLIVHNGIGGISFRKSNIYINASGNFLITIADCGALPLFLFQEPSCFNCIERTAPDINVNVNVIGGGQTSLKQSGKYSVGVYGADLAGRLMYVNVIDDIYIPSFLERDNTLASFIQVLISNTLDLSAYHDIKWITFTITKDESRKRYVQWVGDKIDFIDVNGNVTTDVGNAEFCAIYIQSLFDFNVKNNFSTLAKYQFLKGDRLNIYDDGAGNLFDVGTYGNAINIQVLGTNYNQAAINAGLVPPIINTVFNTTAAQTDFDTSVTLIVRYDSRLDKLKDKTGFWIEVYSPSQTSDVYLYNESAGFYPVINGKIAIFSGYDSGGNPIYTYPTSLDIEFWDTYLINRSISIPDVGQPSFSHLFESPNVNDSFGANLASGGRIWYKNDNAKQMWYRVDTTKSDAFVKNGLINGLATFTGVKPYRKEFRGYRWGEILVVHAEGNNLVAFICSNSWFITDNNFHYAYPNAQGVMITNLNDELSEPHQKVGYNYGLSEEHTGTVIIFDKAIYWLDANNGGFIKMNYQTAIDVSIQSDSENGGVQSYLNAKLSFLLRWNETHEPQDRFEIIAGIDMERSNIFLSFRPVRQFSSSSIAFINDLRNVQLDFQETLVYKIEMHAWTRFCNFVPEYYGKLRGNNANIEMISFAAGKPYIHNNSSNLLFNNFFGIQTTPCIIAVFNKEPASQKILQTLSHDCNDDAFFVDLIYSNVKDSFSWLSLAQFKKKINIWYAAVLRDANSYPDPNKDVVFNRSMLLDGKRMFGFYFVCRFVLNGENNGKYFELKTLSYTYTKTGKADG